MRSEAGFISRAEAAALSNTLASSRNMLGLTRVSSWLRPPPVSGIYPGNDEAGIVDRPSVSAGAGSVTQPHTPSYVATTYQARKRRDLNPRTLSGLSLSRRVH